MVSPFSPPISERSPLFWTKSSYTLANMACVEVAAVESGVLIGDSKDLDGQALSFARKRSPISCGLRRTANSTT